MLTVMIIGGALLISNAKEAVHVETATSVELAKSLTLTAIKALNQGGHKSKNTGGLAELPEFLAQPRHVRIHITGLKPGHLALRKQHGVLVKTGDDVEGEGKTPKWFDDLVRPPLELVRIPIVVNGKPMGMAVIMPEPSHEIAEHWQHARSLSTVMITAYLLLLVVVNWALVRALKPLSTISQGLERLQQGDYSTQLPPIPEPDLRQIGVHFNTLATKLGHTIAALDHTIKEKEAISQKLITVQDAERKKIALELHDEFGPCLFGIKANASHVQSHIGKLLNGAGDDIAKRISTIVDIADHMQKQNRELLHRLRPMALDKFGLPHLLEKLVGSFRANNPDMDWALTLPEDFSNGGESIDLTIYRVVQESFTNAARHSGASSVKMTLSVIGGSSETGKEIEVCVTDNGSGIASDHKPGLGLSGMAERVQGLGGKFFILPGDESGTLIKAIIPLPEISQQDTETLQQQPAMHESKGHQT